jgi:hypothetical protein
MISYRKFIFVAAILAAGVAPSAFAQSADHTGSPLPSYYDGTGNKAWGSWTAQTPRATPGIRSVTMQRNGLHAYARTPSGLRSDGSYGRTVGQER